MNYPRTTGQAARLLDTSEPRLNDLVRRRRIDPAPPVASGRRLWEREHIEQAAKVLGIHNIDRLLAAERTGEDGDDPR